MPASQIIHSIAGCPAPPKKNQIEINGELCAVCGFASQIGITAKELFGANFTDQDLLAAPQAKFACSACAWVMAGTPPDTFRMWSVLWVEGKQLTHSDTYLNYDADRIAEVGRLKPSKNISVTNRGHNRAIVDTLTNPPNGKWLLSITTSGQIHTLPFAKVNSGLRWSVRFERSTVSCTADVFCELLYHVSSLKILGLSDDSIMTGRPNPAFIKCDPRAWKHHAQHITRWTGSDLLALALWCNTKDNYDTTRESARRSYFDRNGREICNGHEIIDSAQHDISRVPVAEDNDGPRNLSFDF